MDKSLDQVLVERGMLSPYELRPAVEEERRSGKPLWQILQDRGLVGARELTKARAAQADLEFVDVAGVNPARDAVAAVPEDVARRVAALPLRVEDGGILVAVAEPQTFDALAEIANVSGKNVTPSLAVRDDLLAALDRAYGRVAHAPVPGAPGMPPPGSALPPPSVAGEGVGGAPEQATQEGLAFPSSPRPQCTRSAGSALV